MTALGLELLRTAGCNRMLWRRGRRWRGRASRWRTRFDPLQQAKEIAVRREHERRVAGQDFLVSLHALEKRVELRGLRARRVCFRINLRRLRVRLAADALRFAVRGGLDFVQVAFLLPRDPRRFAVAFRAKELRDLLPLADHPLVNAREHFAVVIDALEPQVEQLDAKLRQLRRRGALDLRLHFLAPKLDRPQRPDYADAGLALGQTFIVLRLAALVRAHDLDQLVLGDRVANLAPENVLEPRLSAAFIAQADEELQRVLDAPAAKRIDVDVGLVLRRDADRRAVPFEETLVEAVDRLNERLLEVQPRLGDPRSHRPAKFRQHHLLGLLDRVKAARRRDERHEDDRCERRKAEAAAFHRRPSSGLSWSSGSICLSDSSTMTFGPICGTTSAIVSK